MPKQLLIRDVPKEILDEVEKIRVNRGASQQTILLELLNKALTKKENTNNYKFSFIDLFAGIGGFRIALESLGGKCVFTSEWDKHAQKTYQAWHGELPHGDINLINPIDIPDHSILAAGFPCQPFSIAGVSKKNSMGRAHGFKDEKQGNLFFNIVDIVKAKRPPVLLLENVKNLKSHDKGRTWQVISKTLQSLDYDVHNQIIDAAYWVPQHRERVFIVCFDKKKFGDKVDFVFPNKPKSKSQLKDILEPNVPEKYTLTNGLWEYLQRYAEKHRSQGNGFGFGMPNTNEVSRTLSARYYKDGSEILIKMPKGNPRRLTPTECQKLMGYPTKYRIVVSDTQAYRQFGNGVVVPVVKAVAKQILKTVEL